MSAILITSNSQLYKLVMEGFHLITVCVSTDPKTGVKDIRYLHMGLDIQNTSVMHKDVGNTWRPINICPEQGVLMADMNGIYKYHNEPLYAYKKYKGI